MIVECFSRDHPVTVSLQMCSLHLYTPALPEVGEILHLLEQLLRREGKRFFFLGEVVISQDLAAKVMPQRMSDCICKCLSPKSARCMGLSTTLFPASISCASDSLQHTRNRRETRADSDHYFSLCWK